MRSTLARFIASRSDNGSGNVVVFVFVFVFEVEFAVAGREYETLGVGTTAVRGVLFVPSPGSGTIGRVAPEDPFPPRGTVLPPFFAA